MACRTVLALLLWLGAVQAAPQLPDGAPGSDGSPRPPSEECQRTCGGVEIPFPFGNGLDHCRLSRQFQIDCRDDTGKGFFKPFLAISNVEVISISLSRGEMRVLNSISYSCYNRSSDKTMWNEWRWNLTRTPYTFSNTANKFTVVGCRTVAYIGDSEDDDAATYKTGCVSMCRLDDMTTLKNGTCSGMGCCQTAIPSGLQYYKVWFDRRLNTSTSGPCSYAVLREDSSFNFSTTNVTSPDLKDRRVPVVLDWAVGPENCSIAPTKPGYACVSSNSRCIDAAGSRGYICNCKEGFEGNPYLDDGCKDINECGDTAKHSCFGVCNNLNGTFTCSCPAGTRGNATIKGQCQRDPFPQGAQIAVGIAASILVLLVAFLTTEVFRKKQSNKREGYFKQHGGQMLKQILKTEGIDFTFFDKRTIVKATRSFHKDNIVGEGAHGAVYKGIVIVGGATTTVAVKRCKQIDQSRTEEFVQELVILCRVNHPHIVKLLGCCMHCEAPMLVYEFAENGTLNDLLHGTLRGTVTLATRLRIIAEAAEALAYLHSPPRTTLHGDVKPENILLDKRWAAKLADFGCSTLNDNIQIVPKGTLAYLDPEFKEDHQITDKTDVYSLGVVLIELLTGRKPQAKEDKNLTILFQEAMMNGSLDGLLDAKVIVEENDMGVIRQAAKLANQCTAFPGKTRPAMRQVSKVLRRLSNEMPECPVALQVL